MTIESEGKGARVHMHGIDAVRFFAALLVMTYHLAFLQWHKHNIGQMVLGKTLEYPELVAVTWFGWVGVPIFFVISGLVIAYSADRSTPGRFLHGRFVRLVPTAWLCATITFVLLDIRGLGHVGLFVRTLLILPYGPWIDGVYWSLTVEIVFYALVWLLLVVAPKRLELLLWAIGIWSSVFWVLYHLGVPLAVRLADTRHAQMLLLEHGCYFALGGFLWATSAKGATPLRLSACGIFFVAGLLNRPLGEAWSPLLTWAVSVAVIVAALRWQAPERWRAMLKTIGLLTYPLYLVHNIVGNFAMRLLADLGRWPALAGGIAAALLLAWIVMRCEPILRRPFARRRP